MTESEIDRTLEKVRRKKSYFDDPKDLSGVLPEEYGSGSKRRYYG
jgi:hypothetical protein